MDWYVKYRYGGIYGPFSEKDAYSQQGSDVAEIFNEETLRERSLQTVNRYFRDEASWIEGVKEDAFQLSTDASMVERARHVAVQAHMEQNRWNGDAYVTHPMRVADSLTTDDEKIVGYLHDVVEDTELALEDLRSFGFSETILEAIDSVTEREGESYLDFVLRAKANPIGRRVKEADINDNLRDLVGEVNKSRKEKYILAVWVLQHIEEL